MPFYVSVPLPGPFRYGHRIGGRRRGSRWSSWTYWITLGAVFELALWAAFYIVAYLVYGIFAGCRWLVRRARRRQQLHPPA